MLFLFCSDFSFSSFLHSVELSSSGCAQAHPLGVVPEIRTDCSQSVRIFITLIDIRAFLKSEGSASRRYTCAPAGCIPRDSGRVPNIAWFIHLSPSSNRETCFQQVREHALAGRSPRDSGRLPTVGLDPLVVS